MSITEDCHKPYPQTSGAERQLKVAQGKGQVNVTVKMCYSHLEVTEIRINGRGHCKPKPSAAMENPAYYQN